MQLWGSVKVSISGSLVLGWSRGVVFMHFQSEKEMSKGSMGLKTISSLMLLCVQMLTVLLSCLPIKILHMDASTHSIAIPHSTPNQSESPHQPAQAHDTSSIKKLIEAKLKELQLTSGSEPNPKVALLKLRLHLLGSLKQLNEQRVVNLQKVFQHYCTHLNKAGRHITFQRLEYEKVHMTMERFFAFIMDFGLNQASMHNSVVTILEKATIILLFKKCSGNAKNLEFSEFVSCIQRLGVAYFDARHNYDAVHAAMEEGRRKRIEEYRRKQFLKKQKLKQKLLEEQQDKKNNEETKIVKDQQEAPKEASLAEQKEENDDLVKEMMNDASLKHPNQEIARIVKNVGESSERKYEKQEDEVYKIGKAQKVEYYYELMGIDSVKQVEKNLRDFEKPLYRQILEEKATKIEENEAEDKRLAQLKQKFTEREKMKNKSIIAKSLSKEDYERKKQLFDEKLLLKQRGAENSAKPSKPSARKDDPFFINLQMIRQSSMDELNMKGADLKKYIVQDETDRIFMNQYGGHETLRYRAASGIAMGSNKIVLEAKRRAAEVQNAERKSDERKMSRLGLQQFKHQHYLEQFIEKKR